MHPLTGEGIDGLSSIVERVEWRGQTPTEGRDEVAREEPLEIRIGGVPIAVVMRTPGHDLDLVRGFLITERIVGGPADIGSIRHCSTVDTPEAEDNVMQVTPAPGVEVDIARLRRNLFTTSSCGVCGKASIEQAMAVADPIDSSVSVSSATLYDLPRQLEAAQPTFAQTGGLHAAALFDAEGTMLAAREDVGRHNAVDKVIGHALFSAHVGARPRAVPPAILLVSGRVSFEIVQKAVAARVPIVAAVSAPSSLAIAFANRSGLTLAGFLRGTRVCVYAGAARLRP